MPNKLTPKWRYRLTLWLLRKLAWLSRDPEFLFDLQADEWHKKADKVRAQGDPENRAAIYFAISQNLRDAAFNYYASTK